LLARPSSVVFAGAREPEKATALHALKEKHAGRLHILKLISGDEANNKQALQEVEKVAGRLDTIIANAGISKYAGPIESHPPSEFRDHFEVNVVGVLTLFQAGFKLLKSNPDKSGALIVVSSSLGSISMGLPWKTAAYGASKAAVNHLTKTIAVEHPDIMSIALHPGWVQTDMGNSAAKNLGRTAAAHTLEDSVSGMMQIVDAASKETSGKFFNAIPRKSEAPWDCADAELRW